MTGPSFMKVKNGDFIVQSQQWKDQKNMESLFKINNKVIRTASLTGYRPSKPFLRYYEKGEKETPR